MSNKANFQAILESEYAELFENDKDFSYVKTKTNPKDLAAKMVGGILTNSAQLDGKGVKNTCKKIGIKNTRRELQEYLVS